jgi:hypothetical protein
MWTTRVPLHRNSNRLKPRRFEQNAAGGGSFNFPEFGPDQSARRLSTGEAVAVKL